VRVQQLEVRADDTEESQCGERWGLMGVSGGRLGLCRPVCRLLGRLEGVYAIHGRATATELLQAAAGQTMQSIAAQGKQWAEVRTGERSTRDGRDLAPGERIQSGWTDSR